VRRYLEAARDAGFDPAAGVGTLDDALIGAVCERVRPAGNDGLIWPHRDALIWLDLADRLDPEGGALRVDEGGHLADRRSNSAPKKAAAALPDLVRPSELAVLPLEQLQALALLAREPCPPAAVDLVLVDPRPERLGADAELPGDPGHRAVSITALGDRLADHPYRSFSQLRRVAPLRRVPGAVLCHDSIFLQAMKSPPKSGRFTSPH
jgi:hypothetical protein